MKISSAVRDGACWGLSLFYFYVVSQSSLVSGYWMATCCWFFLLWRRSGCFGASGSGYVTCGRPVIVVCAVGEVRCSVPRVVEFVFLILAGSPLMYCSSG